ncbi:hypothetical protein [Helicobacter bilis]|nr:hypothetical protein [Helicobacter bilis]
MQIHTDKFITYWGGGGVIALNDNTQTYKTSYKLKVNKSLK